MNFLRTTFLSGISTSISLVVRLVTNKIIAVYLGTNGMFLLGQLKDFLKITSVFSNLGTTNGTIKYAAEYQEDPDQLKPYLANAFKIHLVLSAVIGLLTILLKNWLSEYLFKTDQYGTFLLVLGLSIVTFSLHTLFVTVLIGLKRVKLYVWINILSTIVSAIVLILLVLKYEIIGALYAFAINQFLVLLISFTMVIVYKGFDLGMLKSVLNMSVIRNLSKFSIMALVGPVCLVLATLFVRNYIIKNFDADHAGSWEAMIRLSGIYILFLTTTFRIYILPTFSKLSGLKLRSEIFKIWRYTFPIIIIIGAGIYLLRDFVINTLFDEKFYLIGTLIAFYILGDTIKINSWVLGNVMIAKVRTKAFIFFQIEWALVFTILTVLLTPDYGFVGVSYAYFGAYVVHFVLMNLYFRKLLWLKS